MTPAARLARCRAALAGVNSSGARTGPSMFDRDVVSFAHGEGVRRPHPSVVAAGVRALLDTEAGALEDYQFLRRWAPLEDRVAGFFGSGGITDLTPDHLCVDSGTSRLFCSFLGAATTRGDTVLAAPGYYHGLGAWCALVGAVLECVPGGPDSQFKLTASALEDWLARHPWARPRAVVLFNPTQTGAVYTPDELRSLATVIRERGLEALEDAVFRLTEYPGVEPPPFLASFDPGGRTVTVGGGSKAFGLANVRIGWACGPPDLMRTMRSHATAVGVTIPHVAQAMAAAALAAPAGYLRRNSAECRTRAASVAAFADSVPGVRVVYLPRAAHSVLLDLNAWRGCRTPSGDVLADSVDVVRYLLEAGRVAVSPGFASGFDDLTVRLCFGCVGARYTYAVARECERLQVAGHGQGQDIPAGELEASFARGRAEVTEGLARIADALRLSDGPSSTSTYTLRWTGSAAGEGHR
jgi:aspartate aminotransferase